MLSKINIRVLVSYAIIIICIPASVIIGDAVFKGEKYAFISFIAAILTCAAFFVTFENREQSIPKLVLIAVLTALSVSGRILFGFTAGFKPVTAIVVIAAVYFGAETGFMIGSMTALLSNFYFGQGMWTPAQMLVWGIIGFIAGLCSKGLKKNMLVLLIFGAISGVLFSFIMDIWTVIWQDGTFNFYRYAATLASSARFTVTYAVSNVIFLLILAVPVGKILNRIKSKYGL